MCEERTMLFLELFDQLTYQQQIAACSYLQQLAIEQEKNLAVQHLTG